MLARTRFRSLCGLLWAMQNIFCSLDMLVSLSTEAVNLPIVSKLAIPLMSIEAVTIDSPEAIERIYTELCRSEPDDGSQTFMGIMDGLVLAAAISLPSDPDVREWAGKMGIRDV